MKKILLLDDEPDFLGLMKMRLEANNYQVATASNGIDFFEKLDNEKPDIVLIDILMPGVNGYQVCEGLKNNKATADIPIILISGHDLEHKGIVDRCIKLGIYAFLTKPVDSLELVATIEKALRKNAREQ